MALASIFLVGCTKNGDKPSSSKPYMLGNVYLSADLVSLCESMLIEYTDDSGMIHTESVDLSKLTTTNYVGDVISENLYHIKKSIIYKSTPVQAMFKVVFTKKADVTLTSDMNFVYVFKAEAGKGEDGSVTFIEEKKELQDFKEAGWSTAFNNLVNEINMLSILNFKIE